MVTEIVPIFITSYYFELFVRKLHDDTAIGDIIKSFISDFRHPKLGLNSGVAWATRTRLQKSVNKKHGHFWAQDCVSSLAPS